MPWLIGSATREHDLGLMVLAILLCALASYTSIRLLRLPLRDQRCSGTSRFPTMGGSPRGAFGQNGAGMAAAAVGMDPVAENPVRLVSAILAFGVGVWTTDCLALLALQPDLGLRFDAPSIAMALAVALLASGAAFAFRPRTLVAGALLGAGITAMHVIDFDAVPRLGGAHYPDGLILIMLAAAIPCTSIAMHALARPVPWLAVLFLVIAVAPFHAFALASVAPVAPAPATLFSLSRGAMATVATGGGFVVVGLAVLCSLVDQRVSQELARDARRLRLLADATFEGLIVARDGRIQDANRAMFELAQSNRTGLLGRELSEYFPGLPSLHAGGTSGLECDMWMPDGQTRPMEVHWRDGPEPGTHLLAVRDLSREKAAELRIERLAHFDGLTGLANREHFEQLLEKTLALSERAPIALGVLYVDIDQFELLAEVMGPVVADGVLVAAAKRLAATVRETDIVARIGRDEFAIIQPLAGHPEDAAALADRIVAEMALPYSVDNRNLVVTASAGVALYPAAGTKARDLIKSAMRAVRRAKAEGRNCWRYFERDLDRLLQEKRSEELALRVALAEGQFTLAYQPYVDSVSMEIVGYEALLRWDHPQRGRIAPGEFIGRAEESGLIVPIGHWVLSTACAEAMKWNAPWVVAVNLSPAQFMQNGIVRTVAEVLRATGLPPSRLELEITETTLMADTENALRTLTALKGLGVKIAMDDFGTGYSSLSYLRKFPFDKIKIDRGFISDVDDAVEAEAIVRAIIAMGRSLRLDVTAEGVETRQQLAMLRALGCRFVQGFLLGRPADPETIGQSISVLTEPMDPERRGALLGRVA